MHTLFGGEASQSATVKMDAIVTQQIRIFVGHHAVAREVYNALFFIHMQYFPYIPLSFCDLIDYFSVVAIVQIKMIPIVPLTHPDYLVAVLQVLTEITGVVHESGTFLFNNRLHLSGFCR